MHGRPYSSIAGATAVRYQLLFSSVPLLLAVAALLISPVVLHC